MCGHRKASCISLRSPIPVAWAGDEEEDARSRPHFQGMPCIEIVLCSYSAYCDAIALFAIQHSEDTVILVYEAPGTRRPWVLTPGTQEMLHRLWYDLRRAPAAPWAP